jgi:hypothetical protein
VGPVRALMGPFAQRWSAQRASDLRLMLESLPSGSAEWE